jgi:transcriptional regulator with XRE-family HTH domain
MINDLKTLRKNKRLKQSCVADLLGVSQGEYSKIESGKRRAKAGEVELLIDKIKQLA